MAGAISAVRDWLFQLENYPYDLNTMSTYFIAKAVFKRLSNITDTGIFLPKLMRYAKKRNVL